MPAQAGIHFDWNHFDWNHFDWNHFDWNHFDRNHFTETMDPGLRRGTGIF